MHGAEWLAAGAAAGAPPLRVLKYDAAHPQLFTELYQASPFSAAAQFDFLRELATNEKLGQTGSFDFVCLVVAAPARLGFETGASSPLMQQMTLQLDLQIESLLAQLRRTVGEKGFHLAVAGCHGAPPAPKPATPAPAWSWLVRAWRRPCKTPCTIATSVASKSICTRSCTSMAAPRATWSRCGRPLPWPPHSNTPPSPGTSPPAAPVPAATNGSAASAIASTPPAAAT
jgi:hypothetical protein